MGFQHTTKEDNPEIVQYCETIFLNPRQEYSE